MITEEEKNMRTPQRKPGIYAGLKADQNITAEKFHELTAKLEKLKKVSQPRAITEMKHSAADGDFSENAAYQIAKGRLRGINQRITDITDHLKRAVIIEHNQNKDRVELGHKVTVEVNGKEKTFLILGSAETNPDNNVISNNSPIGSALMGKKIGDRVQVHLATKIVEYKIIKIE
ncbi:transcription elongation factor GreA [Candidatus Parcubacteria bacterium]|nr:transcription elongation factor GreA [Patescibacteria group bacterium]MBU4309806.1 transcription elongation factor GreA [Patescibacteria group bacterium]MBU4432202.1 transcription elongation factor GreA [Patescibacteria group bacterium]MBU4578145.1 transcription elongation factor GreA [Patescibacteria group bacterium]MCG2696682.1 transcription elongation factor GreA [Candidatus Parcubacteria bacterium]